MAITVACNTCQYEDIPLYTEKTFSMLKRLFKRKYTLEDAKKDLVQGERFFDYYAIWTKSWDMFTHSFWDWYLVNRNYPIEDYIEYYKDGGVRYRKTRCVRAINRGVRIKTEVISEKLNPYKRN